TGRSAGSMPTRRDGRSWPTSRSATGAAPASASRSRGWKGSWCWRHWPSAGGSNPRTRRAGSTRASPFALTVRSACGSGHDSRRPLMHRAPTDEEIRRYILRHLGSGLAPPTMPDDWPLGEAGAGLDSIALVELIVACEVEFGVPLLE